MFGEIFISQSVQAQNSGSIKEVDSLIQEIRNNKDLTLSAQNILIDSAYKVSLQNGDLCRQVYCRAIKAAILDQMGLADSAIIHLYWAHGHFTMECDSQIYFTIQANLTFVLLSLGEYDRIDSVSRIALSHWNMSTQDHELRFFILTNLAISQVLSGDTLRGMHTFRQVFEEAKDENDRNNYTSALINLGTIKAMQNDLDSAYYFFNIASDPTLKEVDVISYMDLQINLSSIEIDKKQYRQAAERLDSLYTLAYDRHNINIQADVQNTRADMFADQGQYKKAYQHVREYVTLQEEALNEERVKAVTEMMEKYESEKKAREIQELKVVNLDATLKNVQITSERNRIFFAGSGILLLSLGLWSRLRNVRRSRRAIQIEKDISEGLLLNILPGSIADELKINGSAKAKTYPSATILFSDFKNFTEITGGLVAEEIVDELNVCFKSFDDIITKHGLEKIKTIGDAYMAAGGVPDTNTASTMDVVLAGIEMQQFIISRRKERKEQQLTAFDMRVGIHSGPVVAGIVGVKKFQYDLWGDTVNTASRMESNGEIDRVNISEATYQQVKDSPDLTFTPRGMIYAKGKGEMAMYFVDGLTQQ